MAEGNASSGVVQIAPDGTGKRVRTVELTTLQSDGTLSPTETQVVALADVDGGLASLGDIVAILAELRDDIHVIRERLEFPEE